MPHTLWSCIASTCVLGCSLWYMPGIFVQLLPFGAFDAEVGKSHHMARLPRVGAPGYTLSPAWPPEARLAPSSHLFGTMSIIHTFVYPNPCYTHIYLCYLGHNRVQPKMNFRCNLRPNSSARTYVLVHRQWYYVNIDEMLFTAVVLLHYMSIARRIRRLLLYVPACPR